jgi:hypothetical protein
VIIILVTAVVSCALTWIFSEVLHKHSAKRNATYQTSFLLKTEQLKILTELQGVVLDYYRIYSEFLWASWEEVGRTLSKKEQAYVGELWDQMEQTALRLFALSSRVDHLVIRSYVDYLEEVARQYAASSGEILDGGSSTKSQENVGKQDGEVQRIAIMLNSMNRPGFPGDSFDWFSHAALARDWSA